jgi:hypothetical protein
MGIKIPGLVDNPNVVPEFTDALLRGTTDLRGYLKVNEVLMTSTPEDINLLAGLVVGAITSGLVKYFEKEVDCSGGGTAQTTAICTIPIGSIILEVMTRCTEAFDGDATQTFEVGLAANTDKYIDPVDCPVTLAGVMAMEMGTNNDQKVKEPLGAAMALIAKWTNTANATAGKMNVKVVYC